MRTACFSVILLCFFAATVMAEPVAISGSAWYLGGLNGTWSFEYTAGAPDLYLQAITIDLSGADLRFDTWPGGFGSLSSSDIGSFSGTDVTTGLYDVSASGPGLDGGLFVTFSFNHFLPGMVFQFGADVDHSDPTLLPLLNCAGKTGLALITCNVTNAGRTATNDARLLGAEWVGPNDMAGAGVSFQFGGENYADRTITGTFGSVTLRDVISGLVQGEGGGAFANGADLQTPEPGNVAILGAGLAVILLGRFRRR